MNSKYQLILDNIPDIAWLVDVKGVFVVVNKAFLDLYHCTSDQIIGKTYSDITDAKTATRYMKEDKEVISKKQAKTIECNVEIEKEGWLESGWLETILTPALDPENSDECVGVIGLSRDITERKQKLQKLQEQQEWLKLYFDSPLIGMAVLNESFAWLDTNQKLCSILGHEQQALMQINFKDLVLNKYQRPLTSALKELKTQKTSYVSLEVEMQHQNNQIIFVRLIIRMTGISTEESITSNFVIMVEEITEKKLAEQRLLLANKVIDASSEAIMVTDSQKDIIRVNAAFTQLTGYEEGEVIGQNPRILKSGRNTQELYKNMWLNLKEKGQWQGEIWDRRKDGSTYPKWMNINAIFRENTKEITHYVALFSDVTERKRTENKIRYMAYHDALTGLPNKALLETRLIRAITEAEEDQSQLALIQLDLDNFKTINDSMGHYVGDELLKEVGRHLKKCFRKTDIIARLGGDEFIIMLDKLSDYNNVQKLAKNILESFVEPLSVLGYTMHITPSIGICIYPEDGENHELLMQNVDIAMSNAKSNGKNRYVFFNKDMTKAVLKRITLEYKMRGALDKEEFTLFYQPQVNLVQQKVVGVEALIRWTGYPENISPEEFIPVAEETGLIIPIGEWILKQACLDCKSWHKLGHKINVAVNLSAQQFELSYLTKLVAKTLKDSGISAKFLDLEITESLLMNDSNAAVQTLNKLKKMGIQLSIDDFGTGYSSLAYLKAFNVDKLKIDRSFITGLPDDKDDVAIAIAIIQLAKSLGMKIVAEGAEEERHIDFLKQHKCDQIQGYYYAKPMPSDDLVTFLDAWGK